MPPRRFGPAQRGGLHLTASTTVNTTLGEIWAERKGYAATELLFYRATEKMAHDLPDWHHNPPRDPKTRLLRQITEHRGIHSCVNTSQLNGMLWQGQISHAVASRINASFLGQLRGYFGEETQSQRSALTFRPGFPLLARHFYEVEPAADFSYFDSRIGSDKMFDVAVSELLRGSVLVADLPEHTVLAVGYAGLNLSNPDALNLTVIDPLDPTEARHEPLSNFFSLSHLIPSPEDPMRQMTELALATKP